MHPNDHPSANSLSGDGRELLVVDRPPDLALVPLRPHVERAREVRQDLPPLLGQLTLRPERGHHRRVRSQLCNISHS